MRNWDKYYLDIAEVTAEMATCNRLQVGAVLVDPDTKEIISTGFNGSPHGHPHCTEDGCLKNDEGRCIRTIHAEHNAILHAKRDLRGCVMYCTHEPCESCTKYMAQVGITRVVYKYPYENKYNKHFNQNMSWEHYQEMS